MTYLLATLSIILAILLNACAPSTESAGSSQNTDKNKNTNTAVTASSNIIAEQDFDFRGDRLVEISFDQFPSEKGKFNIYSKYEFYDLETNIYYPDYATRLASFIAIPDQVYQLQVNDTWAYLVLEWLPMDSLSNESYLFTALNSSDTYSLHFNEQ